MPVCQGEQLPAGASGEEGEEGAKDALHLQTWLPLPGQDPTAERSQGSRNVLHLAVPVTKSRGPRGELLPLLGKVAPREAEESFLEQQLRKLPWDGCHPGQKSASSNLCFLSHGAEVLSLCCCRHQPHWEGLWGFPRSSGSVAPSAAGEGSLGPACQSQARERHREGRWWEPELSLHRRQLLGTELCNAFCCCCSCFGLSPACVSQNIA